MAGRGVGDWGRRRRGPQRTWMTGRITAHADRLAWACRGAFAAERARGSVTARASTTAAGGGGGGRRRRGKGPGPERVCRARSTCLSSTATASPPPPPSLPSPPLRLVATAWPPSQTAACPHTHTTQKCQTFFPILLIPATCAITFRPYSIPRRSSCSRPARSGSVSWPSRSSSRSA